MLGERLEVGGERDGQRKTEREKTEGPVTDVGRKVRGGRGKGQTTEDGKKKGPMCDDWCGVKGRR